MMFSNLLNRFKHMFVKHNISRLDVLDSGPHPDHKYWPSCSISTYRVLITIMYGDFIMLSPGYPISPPNLLEYLVGITFEDKINRTSKKVQNRCDKMNKAESYAKNSLISSGVNNGRY